MKKSGVIIGVLVTIIVALITFIVLIKLDVISFNTDKSEKEPENSNMKNSTEEKITNDEVSNLINKYTKSFFLVNIFKSIELSQHTKAAIAFTNLSENDFKSIDCSEYSEKLVYEPIGVIKNDKEMGYRDSEHLYCYENSFSYLTVNNVYHELFGNKLDFSKSDFKIGLSKYKYSNTNDRFEEYVVLGGIEYITENIYSVIGYSLNDDNLVVEVGYASYIDDFDEYKPEIDGMPYYTKEQMEKLSYSKIINDNIDLVEKYKFTFFKEDGLYKLSKIEKL